MSDDDHSLWLGGGGAAGRVAAFILAFVIIALGLRQPGLVVLLAPVAVLGALGAFATKTFLNMRALDRARHQLALRDAGEVVVGTPIEPAPGSTGYCPRGHAAFVERVGGDEVDCTICHGVMLRAQATSTLLERAGIAIDVARTLAKEQGRPSVLCPDCQAVMREVQLRGRAVDLCLSCGAVWLDAGERPSFTGGLDV